MSVDVKKERQRLSQTKFIEWVMRPIRPSEMVTVYLSDHVADHNIGIYCCLIPNDAIGRSLDDLSWDLSCGGGHPGAVIRHEGGKEVVEYLRYGEYKGIEPLVIYREFYGMRENYLEISEEFRLFHRLFHDRKQEQYIKIDDSGNEHPVVIVKPKRIEIRLQEIQQFLAIKEMHLAEMFDCRENSPRSLHDLGIQEGEGKNHRDELSVYMLSYGGLHGLADGRGFSRLLGKRLFRPFPKEKSGFWGFAPSESKKAVDFIIEADEHGDEITNSSNPDRLSNYFGANPGEPNYLTPVHFRKEVLNKYYQQPNKYSVEDGYLRCGSLWGMTMDNHHVDRVVTWLGDLGRDLPYEEQLHWRSFNVPPSGGVSKTFYKRQILAEYADSDQPEHVFKYQYRDFSETCKEKLGWLFLLPLAKEDAHFLEALRIPATDEQKDFDELILGLTKILVDSLNEKELNHFIPASEIGEIKGSIARLEKVLSAKGVAGYEKHIKFLRDLQNLRSSGTAHRKGSNYRKTAEELEIDSQSLRMVFEGILVKGIELLKFLEGLVRSGCFGAAP
ncbi:MAG: hypothetical protein A4E74_01870 [Syntrophus sp. PtaB.Bin075]|nr:MAG: hypothetical protein A4E74_01870 [Syntrophus sp. PtaB.Bin075]